ncbi:MAG: cytochrome C assembly protein [Candidatus Latescibacteria bacterium]|nr:cytochrome C assembly protein [Candidatus Latescibacterota bacterium]NIM22395.1 cytochrome C assembly protein [Candidatus Latescibacterota bacterium]NIM64755.1 cytochrome C assembly protein [Candidatus Latescibacterota bacterium]NIO01266.1 cytochrome C assembly protein [Candidatus Latescibacterota bacterium]NIO27758.1 cytochrome C assembly protein [Candidatus Latescibacterota bacterium]
MLFAVYMVFVYAPVERTMGIVQKIFYFHVPSAWIAFLAFFCVFLFSIVYLMRREKKWDDLASSSAEVGVLFCSLVLITGPIWAKPVWGVWWTWDSRLTLTLVLWLLYVGYMMLRYYVADPEKKATLSAVVGIIGFIDVPLVYLSIRWWRTQHPSPVMAGGSDSGLDPDMARAFFTCLAAFTILFVYLLMKRVKLEKLREELDGLQERVEETHPK